MTLPAIPPPGSIDWYPWATAIHQAVSEAAANTPAGSGSAPLYGLYADRPEAATVTTGTVYHAADTREHYVARGPDGQPATSWWAPPANGGAEVGFGQTTIPTWTMGAGSGWIGIPGCYFGTLMGERPLYITAKTLIRFVATDDDPVIGLWETTPGHITQLDEAHPGQQNNFFDFGEAFLAGRVSGRPGTWRSFEMKVLRRTIAYTMANSPVFPSHIRGVLG